MQATEVRITRLEAGGAGKVLAFASVTLDDVLVVKDFRIIDGEEGPWLAWPSRKADTKGGDDETEDGGDRKKKYYDTVFPLKKEVRTQVSDFVLEQYRNGGGER